MDAKITEIREELSNTNVMKGKLEGQINVLNEQIKAAQMTDDSLKARLDQLESDREERKEQQEHYLAQKQEIDSQVAEIEARKQAASDELEKIQREIARCTQGIEEGKNEIIEILNNKASTKAKLQKFDTMAEQVNIRKAQLNQRLLKRKSEEADLQSVLSEYQDKLAEVSREIEALKAKEKETADLIQSWRKKTAENRSALEKQLLIIIRENPVLRP